MTVYAMVKPSVSDRRRDLGIRIFTVADRVFSYPARYVISYPDGCGYRLLGIFVSGAM
jgi:hypothetical protein